MENAVTDTEEAAPAPPKLGRPYTPISDALCQLLDASYLERAPKSIDATGYTRDAVAEVVRLARIYAHRHGKTLRAQLTKGHLWLHMADKRPYTRRNV